MNGFKDESLGADDMKGDGHFLSGGALLPTLLSLLGFSLVALLVILLSPGLPPFAAVRVEALRSPNFAQDESSLMFAPLEDSLITDIAGGALPQATPSPTSEGTEAVSTASPTSATDDPPTQDPTPTEILDPIVTEVVDPLVTEVIDPLVTEVIDPLVTEVVDPLVTEVVDPLVTEAIDPILTLAPTWPPLLSTEDPLLEPILKGLGSTTNRSLLAAIRIGPNPRSALRAWATIQERWAPR